MPTFLGLSLDVLDVGFPGANIYWFHHVRLGIGNNSQSQPLVFVAFREFIGNAYSLPGKRFSSQTVYLEFRFGGRYTNDAAGRVRRRWIEDHAAGIN